MSVSVEVTACTIRCGPHHTKHGDPWEFSVQAQIFDGTAYLYAGQGQWLQQRRAILKALQGIGVQRVELVRIQDGRKRRDQYEVGGGDNGPVLD